MSKIMLNKELYDKIINAKCTLEELKAFNIDIDKKEFDADNAFEKYYDSEMILHVISRYKNNEINDEYLAYWANAYNWIISAGFKTEENNDAISFKQWLEWEISDCLDGLSFFDSSGSWANIDDYKQVFIVLDKIYNNLNDWRCAFAHTDKFGDNDDDVVMLVINDKTKEFVEMYEELDYLNRLVQIDRIEPEMLENEITRLKEQSFHQLMFWFSDN